MGTAVMIGIIDYGMGNLRSVQKAFERVGAVASVLGAPAEAEACSAVVLPGVGAFADGMANLERSGWVESIQSYVGSGRPFLGICLGMQLLFEGSQEGAAAPDELVAGLGLLQGRVERFVGESFGPDRLKVPHMGWNRIAWSRPDPLFEGLEPPAHVYFVHEYHVLPTETGPDTVSGSSQYGGRLCASVWRGNIWGTQFHPEKSQSVGMRMLANFSDLADGFGR